MEENADAAPVDSEDNSSFLDDEIEALQSIYISETEVEKDVNSTVVSIDLHPATADNHHEQYVKMTLKLNLLEGYPEVIPEIDIRNPRGLSDEKLNSIMEDLIDIAESKRGNSMLFEIIEAAKDHLTVENRPCEECAICLYGFQDDDVFTKTECYHYFHSHCLARYAKKATQEESNYDENAEQDTELLCPVCRLPIQFEGSEASYPAPVREDEEIVVPNDLIEMQKKMSELYLKQVEKGGIIDIEAEKNKYLLEISQVPSATDDTRLEEDESQSTVTEVPKDNSETLPQESNVSMKNKTENSQGSIAKSTVSSDTIKKGNEKIVKHNSGRTKKYNESVRDRNKYHGGGYGGNRKSDKYKDYRENEEHDEDEERNEKFDNYRRNDRYGGERINNRYSNDRSSNHYLGDRRNDRQNERYYGERRNDRYNKDIRNNRYSDDRRNDRYNGDNRSDRYHSDRRNDYHNGNRRNGRYVNDRNDYPGSNKRGDYDNKSRNENFDNKQKNTENDNREDHECDDSKKNDSNGKIDQHGEDADRENDRCDEKDLTENDRKNDRYMDRRNPKYSGYRRNDRYNGPKWNDRYDNDRRNFRFEGDRRNNYKKNSGYNEGRKNENYNRKYVKTIEESKLSVTSEVKQQELSQSNEMEAAIDHKKSESIENAETYDSISNCQKFPNDRQRTEISTQSSDHRNKADRNRGTNRQTNENNYGKQNFRKDSNKRYNTSRNYNRDYSEHTQGKHSIPQSNQIAEDGSLNHTNIDKNEASESTNERAYGKSNTRHIISHETKTDNKNYECGDDEINHSNRKSSQKFHTSYNDRGMHPRRNSFKNYHEGRSERDDRNRSRNYSFKDSLSSKNPSNSNNKQFNAPSNSSATVNDKKIEEVPSTKSNNENGHYRNDAEIVNYKCKETNVPETVSSEKLSNGSAVVSALEVTKEPENSVPSSNFLPPMSSIAPPPGFLNPSRKVVYGLAAANPPPGFHRS